MQFKFKGLTFFAKGQPLLIHALNFLAIFVLCLIL